MAKKKKKKGNEIIGLTKGIMVGGIGIGAGATAVAKLPTETAAIQQSFTKISGFFPLYAKAGMSAIVLKKVRKLGKKRKY